MYTSVRPIIAPHYHYDNSDAHNSHPIAHNSEPFLYNYVRPVQENRYDLVTGEYLRHNQQNNQTLFNNNYLFERRRICCKFCERTIPVNWLTISLFTCFIFLIMLTIFQVAINSNAKKYEIKSLFLQEFIWILSCIVIFLSLILIIRYICTKCTHKKLCQKCTSGEEEDDTNDSFNYYSSNYNEQFV
jgi:hypothetical protein